MTAAELIAAARSFEQERGAETFADLWLAIFEEFESRSGFVMPEDDEPELEIVAVH